MDDGRIYFAYLDHLIREDVFSIVDKDECLFRFNSTRLSCELDALDAKLTLVVTPKILEGVITREVYVEVNSKGNISLEDWELCLSALFSFIFSIPIGGSRIWPFEPGQMQKRLRVPKANGEEIKRTGGEYRLLYRHLISEFPLIFSKWAASWFDHAARPLGLYKYLEVIRGLESIAVELQLSLISEAFVHYFGDKDSRSAKECIKQQYGKLSNDAGVRLHEDVTIKTIWTFYGNFKHFTKGNQETSPTETVTDKERVRLSYFAKSLFQFSVLYQLLEDNLDTFRSVYEGLVENHLVLNKIYVL